MTSADEVTVNEVLVERAHLHVGDTVGLLGVVFAAVAMAVVAFRLAASQRMRRRDLAVLRALGVTRRQVRGAVRWEALGLGLAGILLGIPSGVAVAGLLSVALVASAWPASSASRLRPADVLPGE